MKRLNKTKGMYALLIAVAAMIGITIYASCSADDDYDNYSSGNELFTLADGEMSLRSDVGGGIITYVSDSIPVSNKEFKYYGQEGTFSDITLSFNYYIVTNDFNNFSISTFGCNNNYIRIHGTVETHNYNSNNHTYNFGIIFGAYYYNNNSIFWRAEDTVCIQETSFTQNSL